MCQISIATSVRASLEVRHPGETRWHKACSSRKTLSYSKIQHKNQEEKTGCSGGVLCAMCNWHTLFFNTSCDFFQIRGVSEGRLGRSSDNSANCYNNYIWRLHKVQVKGPFLSTMLKCKMVTWSFVITHTSLEWPSPASSEVPILYKLWSQIVSTDLKHMLGRTGTQAKYSHEIRTVITGLKEAGWDAGSVMNS